MSEPESTKSQWSRLARGVSSKINAGWWLDTLGVPLVVTALGISCFILLARRELPVFPWLETSLAGGAIILLAAGLAWWIARRRFESPEQSMVRIEASMKLRNSLSAARAGVVPWPEVPARVNDGTHWHWPRLVTPVFASVLFIAGSILLPVSARTDPNQAPPDSPQAWKDLEADIETLSEEDTVQEQYLEELEERLKELKSQDEDDWFSHSSLEATDALKKAHGAEVEDLERGLRKAERALNALQKHGDKMGEGARERLLNEFDNALQQMGNGAAKPNKELLEKLQGLDPKQLGKLDQEQLDQLRENMKKHAGQCGNCQGNGPGQDGGKGDEWLDELLEEGNNPGQGQGNGQNGQPRNGPGKGGVNRGPGTAPGVLGRLKGDVETGEMEGLESRDLSRTLPGDLLELMDGEHDVDKTAKGIREGGGVAGEGTGGDRIWKDALLPDEKKALKEFFK